jgi:hypothetical protein
VAKWLQGHLPGAITMLLLDIESTAKIVDPSQKSLVYCHEGLRATTAASILLRESVDEICILIDGVEGWLVSGLRLECPKPGNGFPPPSSDQTVADRIDELVGSAFAHSQNLEAARRKTLESHICTAHARTHTRQV